MRAADYMPKAAVRPRRKVSMWLPVDMLDELAELGGAGMTANLIAIYDAAVTNARATGKRVKLTRKGRKRGDKPRTVEGGCDVQLF